MVFFQAQKNLSKQTSYEKTQEAEGGSLKYLETRLNLSAGTGTRACYGKVALLTEASLNDKANRITKSFL